MPAQPLLPGDPRRLGDFMLVGRLGEGGQGIVYLGLTPDGRQVAVKVLKTGADQQARKRLAQEIAAAMRVRPFCTARVLASSVDAELPYIVSEYVDGPSLQDRVAQRGPLVDGDLDRLIVNTTTALAAIHSARIVHRDLKPGNVLLGPDGPRVVDFGISRPADQQTMSGQLIGTPAYFSPEQLRRHSATPASDLFAWAGTMVFAATGHPPFDHDDLAALFHAILEDPPDLDGVPAHVRPLLAACLDKDPARRPTARDLIGMLLDPDVGVDPGDDVDPGFTEVVELLNRGAEADSPLVVRADPEAEPEPAAEPEPETEPRPEAKAEPKAKGEPEAEPEPKGGPEPETGPGPGAGPAPARRPRVHPPRVRAHETITPESSTLDTDPGDGPERRIGPPPGTPAEGPAEGPPPEPAGPGPAPVRSRRRGPFALPPKVALPVWAALVAVLVLSGLALSRIIGGDAGGTIPAEYGGRWTGSLYQTGGIDSRNVDTTVVLDAGGTSGRVEVPSTGCSGVLTLTDVRRDGLRFRLSTDGADCPSGAVQVYLHDGLLGYDLAAGVKDSLNGDLRRSG